MARAVAKRWLARSTLAAGRTAGLVVATAAGGCDLILGFDKEYELGHGGASGYTADTTTGGNDGSTTTGRLGGCGGAVGAVGELGDPCPDTGLLGCQGNTSPSKLICNPDGKWATNGTCDNETLCDTTPGLSQGTCKPIVAACKGKSCGDVVCDGQTRLRCETDLVTSETLDTCENQTCIDGACVGECAPGRTRCSGNTAQICGAGGEWQDDAPCTGAQICVSGACIVPPSCENLTAQCGPLDIADESCCARVTIPGGTYNRSNDSNFPATVSDFQVDRFEITVGRFRAFVNAYPSNKPANDAGKHPLINDSGWKPGWDSSLPASQEKLKADVKCPSGFPTWTDNPGDNENLPMNCVTWYEAFAFCAWDGGRLPTEAEWNYAAAGGSEQRPYPWTEPLAPTVIDKSYAVYNCQEDSKPYPDCVLRDIQKVGSKSPNGDGRAWGGLKGPADLGGNLWEWNLDHYQAPYDNPCNDCAHLVADASEIKRVRRGGGWRNKEVDLSLAERSSVSPTLRGDGMGFRCARSP
jgi:formylglycine-generating enzyme